MKSFGSALHLGNSWAVIKRFPIRDQERQLGNEKNVFTDLKTQWIQGAANLNPVKCQICELKDGFELFQNSENDKERKTRREKARTWKINMGAPKT